MTSRGQPLATSRARGSAVVVQPGCMSSVRCAVGLPNVGDYGDPRLLVELAQRAEDAGWDGRVRTGQTPSSSPHTSMLVSRGGSRSLAGFEDRSTSHVDASTEGRPRPRPDRRRASRPACNDPVGMPPRPNVFAETFSIEPRGSARRARREQGGRAAAGRHPLRAGSRRRRGVPALAPRDGGARGGDRGHADTAHPRGRSRAGGRRRRVPRGRSGAHTLANRSGTQARYLMVSTKVMPEIVEYPEQGTVRVLTRSPWEQPDPNQDPADRLALLFDRSYAKEDPPAS